MDDNEFEGLTKEEDAKCFEAFSAFDKDSSGKIDANELRIVLEMMGQKTTEEEIFRMIAEADAENKLETFINYIKDTKVVVLEDLATHFKMKIAIQMSQM